MNTISLMFIQNEVASYFYCRKRLPNHVESQVEVLPRVAKCSVGSEGVLCELPSAPPSIPGKKECSPTPAPQRPASWGARALALTPLTPASRSALRGLQPHRDGADSTRSPVLLLPFNVIVFEIHPRVSVVSFII